MKIFARIWIRKKKMRIKIVMYILSTYTALKMLSDLCDYILFFCFFQR